MGAGPWGGRFSAPVCGCGCPCHTPCSFAGSWDGCLGERDAFPRCCFRMGDRKLPEHSMCLPCLPLAVQIQTALRHKSEIEHHRNKIRLRAKRRGHYEFPVVDDLSSGDTRERHRVYRRAQMQIDKILDPTASVPSVFIEPRKRCASSAGPPSFAFSGPEGSAPTGAALIRPPAPPAAAESCSWLCSASRTSAS